MEEEPQVHAVLDFLTRRGFSSAASALRDEAVSRGIEISSDEDSIPPLPPVKITPGRGGVTPGLVSSSASSSSGDFFSIGSSPFELRNPYGIWSPARTGSSARNSEFGTAPEYNESILFGDSGWYGDQFAGCCNDPYLLPANQNEERIVMSIEAEKKFTKLEGSSSTYGVKQESCVCLGSTGVYGSSFPFCDCYKGNWEEKLSRLDIMDNEGEMLNGCEDDGIHLKRVDGCTMMIPQRSDMDDLDRGAEDRVLESLSRENLKFSMDETSSFAFTDFVPEFMQNKDLTTVHFLENNNSEVLGNGYNDEKLLCWKTSELEANDESECGIVDGDIKDSESLSADGENDDIPDDHQLFTAHEVELETFDLRIIHRKNRTGFEENKDLQIVLNSIVAGRYYLTESLGSAAFSKVVQARDLYTGTDVCLKIIKNDKDFFDQSLDEIKLLKYVNKNDPSDQCHLVRLYDYFYHKEHLFIVCELLRANLYEFQKFNQDLGGDIYFTLQRIQAIARQCLEALQYLHGLKVIHCDLKPENILIKSYSRCEIKIIDLGSSCFLTDNLRLYEQSRSYRAPEVILGVPYDEKIDIWSLGCILAELYTGEVLFLNDSLAMILARMIGMLGPIDAAMLENGQEAHKYFTEDYDLYLKNEETDTVEYLIPERSSLAYSLQVNDAAFLDFLGHLLQVNPERRLTASQALRHGWLSVSYK
ncbi:Serine/threonine-protein kinase AFC3 [Platanthera zijinensis]|uniref:Serine/threonine-protein kinase AFC3 n=1 Tax=Platanthera zijinensis TaxID=2320716 RepID=A0AAP0FYQ2_9ASPA